MATYSSGSHTQPVSGYQAPITSTPASFSFGDFSSTMAAGLNGLIHAPANGLNWVSNILHSNHGSQTTASLGTRSSGSTILRDFVSPEHIKGAVIQTNLDPAGVRAITWCLTPAQIHALTSMQAECTIPAPLENVSIQGGSAGAFLVSGYGVWRAAFKATAISSHNDSPLQKITHDAPLEYVAYVGKDVRLDSGAQLFFKTLGPMLGLHSSDLALQADCIFYPDGACLVYTSGQVPVRLLVTNSLELFYTHVVIASCVAFLPPPTPDFPGNHVLLQSTDHDPSKRPALYAVLLDQMTAACVQDRETATLLRGLALGTGEDRRLGAPLASSIDAVLSKRYEPSLVQSMQKHEESFLKDSTRAAIFVAPPMHQLFTMRDDIPHLAAIFTEQPFTQLFYHQTQWQSHLDATIANAAWTAFITDSIFCPVLDTLFAQSHLLPVALVATDRQSCHAPDMTVPDFAAALAYLNFDRQTHPADFFVSAENQASIKKAQRATNIQLLPILNGTTKILPNWRNASFLVTNTFPRDNGFFVQIAVEEGARAFLRRHQLVFCDGDTAIQVVNYGASTFSLPRIVSVGQPHTNQNLTWSLLDRQSHTNQPRKKGRSSLTCTCGTATALARLHKLTSQDIQSCRLNGVTIGFFCYGPKGQEQIGCYQKLFWTALDRQNRYITYQTDHINLQLSGLRGDRESLAALRGPLSGTLPPSGGNSQDSTGTTTTTYVSYRPNVPASAPKNPVADIFGLNHTPLSL